jgi:hypothetical protein
LVLFPRPGADYVAAGKNHLKTWETALYIL